MAQSVHGWIRSNRLVLVEGLSQHRCPIIGVPGREPTDITLTVRVENFQEDAVTEPGILYVRRQQVQENLGDIMERALRRKLPKLVNTEADKRILLLERQHMEFSAETHLGRD